ncbi:MAG TPA: CGNR zinc finger domain-containing protein [Paraburkholderia sp.]|nr:CGNR zinc finger domain-containing protein [Paraburkholderia sp.]
MALARSIKSEFRFNSGRLCLDLAATVRRRASHAKDVLATSGASGRWLHCAGLFQQAPALSESEEAGVRQLREAIWELVAGSMHGELPAQAVSVVNSAARYPLGTPQLDPATGGVAVISDNPLATALSVIARDAIDLVSGPLRMRVKTCDQADCRMLFVDTSTAGQRRWCSMQRCGSRAKADTFMRKHRDSQGQGGGQHQGRHRH